MGDVEGGHLRTAPPAGGADGEAHLVEDIHERQRPAGARAGAGHQRAARAQGGELVADAAAGLEGQPRLVKLGEDVVHRVADGGGDGAVDGRGGRPALLGAGVGDDSPGRDGAVAQCPEKLRVPVFAQLGRLHIGQGAGDPPPGGVEIGVDRRAVGFDQPVFLRPDVRGGGLQRDAARLLRCGAAMLGHTPGSRCGRRMVSP
ncbi:hypothetical protein D3C78_1059430 [compost metagenome]